MQDSKSDSPQNRSTHYRPKSTFHSLKVVIGVAALLATLFTIWTPGKQLNALIESLTRAQQISRSPQDNLQTTVEPGKTKVGVVVGHWKNDSGAICSDGLREVDINLTIATHTQKLLSDQGYLVDLLEEFDVRLENYQAKALVSIHADSCEFINKEATGFKVAAAIGTKYPEVANRLTACLQSRYATITGLSLHIKSITIDMTSYHAFSEIDPYTPAAIIETGFMNLDRQFLTEKPETAAQGIVNGILCFLRNESIEPTQASPAP